MLVAFSVMMPAIKHDPGLKDKGEPTIFPVYISEKEEPSSKNEDSDQNMIEGIEKFLTKEEEEKLSRLMGQKNYKEAKKYLEALFLEKYNIQIEFVTIPASPPIDPKNPQKSITDVADGLADWDLSWPDISHEQQETRKIASDAGKWLKAIEEARRKNEKHRNID